MLPISRFMAREPYSVKSTDNLERARTLMDRHSIRHLPVIDGDKLLGILLGRDLAILESIPGMKPAHVEVARVMVPALSVPDTMPIDDALELMTKQRADCVVVRDNVGVIGIFTSTDAVIAVAAAG